MNKYTFQLLDRPHLIDNSMVFEIVYNLEFDTLQDAENYNKSIIKTKNQLGYIRDANGISFGYYL